MADVIGILGFALHAAHKVYNIIQSIQDAPSDVRALRDNAFQVHGFLEDLLDKQTKGESGHSPLSRDDQSAAVAALVEQARDIVAAANKFIEKTTEPNEDGTYSVKKLQWLLKPGKAKALAEQFRSFYIQLTAVYTVSSSYVSGPSCNAYGLTC